jgi:RNA polymerase sigma factor (TIGR02999 family)
MTEITRILAAAERGDPHAAEQLLPLVYEELRKLARQKMASEAPGQTMQATALVHEAYLRLLGNEPDAQARETWRSRGHFLAAAAEAMRRILIDQARRKSSKKRGGRGQRLGLDAAACMPAPDDAAEGLLALDVGLQRLEREEPIKAQVVKLRYFAGLSWEATARTLGISPATAKRYWTYARSWLHAELYQD